MARPPFATLGGRSFRTKTQLVAELRALLKASALGAPLPLAEQAMLADLLRRHPHHAEKVGAGIRHFEVREHYFRDTIRQRGFYVVRTDGSAVDFSFYMCLLPDSADLGQLALTEACRAAVVAQVAARKAAHFAGSGSARCEETGALIAWDQAHVDHAGEWPFSRIVEAWIAGRGGPPPLQSDALQTVFADEGDAAEFVRFHDARAVLRVIDARLNIGRRDRARPMPAEGGC